MYSAAVPYFLTYSLPYGSPQLYDRLGSPVDVEVAAPLADQGLGEFVNWMGVFRVCQVRSAILRCAFLYTLSIAAGTCPMGGLAFDLGRAR